MIHDPADAAPYPLADVLPLPLWAADAGGAVQFVNLCWREYAGLSAGELRGGGWAAVLHPDDLPAFQLRWDDALARRKSFEAECRLRRAADGSYRWFVASVAPRAADDPAAGWCGTFTDIDRQKLASQEVNDLEKFLDSIVENIPDMIFVKDAAELRFVLVNRKAGEDLLGLPREQLIGRNDHDLFSAADADYFTGVDRRVLESGELLDIPEEPLETPRGRRILHTKKIPVLDAAGKPQYLLGIARDITSRKSAEEQLREKNRLLEESARSERQAHEALKQTQSQLMQSEKLAALGELVAGVAHEINNPLAFVSNNVVVLQRDLAELHTLLKLYRDAEPAIAKSEPATVEAIHELVERIDLGYTMENLPQLLSRSREGLRRIQQIVRDLRDFSRQEAVGEWHEGADLNAGIESTVNIVRGRAKKQQVEIELALTPLPGITCYPAKLNQVVMNLVANAIDACPANGKVTIRTRPADGGVELEVTDTGSGIDPVVRGRIFDPFFTTKPQGQGTGLGLSISHGIVADHGGRIGVESEVGKGTTFTVYLPLVPEGAKSATDGHR